MEYQKDYQAFGSTLIGSRQQENESQFLVKPELGLYIVCDGKGESGKGAQASKLVVDFIENSVNSQKSLLAQYEATPTHEIFEKVSDFLADTIKKTSHQIHQEIMNDKERKRMASTIVLALVVGNNAVLAHVGSSSIYLQREGEIHSLTKKTRELLGQSDEIKIETIALEINRGDNLLLCTEGLDGSLSEERIGAVLQEKYCEDYVDDLLSAVKKDGDYGTATTVAISFHAVKLIEEKASAHQKVQALKKMPLFSLLEFKEITKVMGRMTNQSYKMDEVVVIEGAEGEELFVIIKGTADVVVGSKVINTLKTGDYFGELSLIDKEPRSATVQAKEDLEVLVMHKDDFYKIISKEKNISIKLLWKLTKTLSARLRKTDSLLSEVGEGTRTLIDVEALKLDLE